MLKYTKKNAPQCFGKQSYIVICSRKILNLENGKTASKVLPDFWQVLIYIDLKQIGNNF